MHLYTANRYFSQKKLTNERQDKAFIISHCRRVLSQARLSCGKRESGQVPIRLLCCILSSRAPNEVSVNINWDMF